MAELKQYTAKLSEAPINGGRRAEGGDFAADFSSVGPAMQKVGTQRIERIEDDESRKAVVASAEIRAKYAKALDEAALSGAPLEPIKEQMQGDLSKVSDSFTTKKAVDHMKVNSANADLMFDEQSNHISVSRARSAATLQGNSFVKSESATIQSNPLYLPLAEQNVDQFASTLTGVSPEFKAEIADKLKKDLNMAAVMSASRIDPEGTKKKLDAGEWNLTTEQRNLGLNKTDAEIRAKRADEALQRSLAEKAKHDANEESRDRLFKGIMAGDKGIRRQIMDDQTITAATREHLITFQEHRAKALAGGDNKSDPIIKKNLWLGVNAPEGDPRKVYGADAIFEAVKAGTLSTTDADKLNTQVANQKDENNRSIGSRIGVMTQTVGRALSQDPQFAAQPALVADIQNDYIARVQSASDELRKNKQDPSQIFDPSNKAYVGSRGFIQESINKARQSQRDAMPKAAKVSTQAEYDALPDGAAYVDSNGQSGTKRGKAKAPAAAKKDW